MRVIWVFVMLAIPQGVVWAQCPDSLLWSTPGGSALLPTDGYIVVKGFGPVGRQVSELAHRRPTLRAEGDVVPVVVIGVDEGSADDLSIPVAEATLVPLRHLKPGTRYQLDLADLDPRRGSAWKNMVWTTAPAEGVAFQPEKVLAEKSDGPRECAGVLGEKVDTRGDIIRVPVPPPRKWALGFKLLAVIVLHCGLAVATAAWIATRGRKQSEAQQS